MGVYTCTLCSCEDQRCREKAVGGATTMAWGLRLFVHRNGVCVGPGPPSLILYQLTPTPHPHTRTQQRRKLTRAWLFSFFFPFFFPSLSLLVFSFLLPLLSQDLLHSFGRAFLKLQFLSHEGRRSGQGCLWGCFLCTYACVWSTVLCFILCLWPCRSHLDRLLWPDYEYYCECAWRREEIMMWCLLPLLHLWTCFYDYSPRGWITNVAFIYKFYFFN